MTDAINTAATALGVFAGTNVDDPVVLTVLFLTSRAAGKPKPWQIVAVSTSASAGWYSSRSSRPLGWS